MLIDFRLEKKKREKPSVTYITSAAGKILVVKMDQGRAGDILAGRILGLLGARP